MDVNMNVKRNNMLKSEKGKSKVNMWCSRKGYPSTDKIKKKMTMTTVHMYKKMRNTMQQDLQ